MSQQCGLSDKDCALHCVHCGLINMHEISQRLQAFSCVEAKEGSLEERIDSMPESLCISYRGFLILNHTALSFCRIFDDIHTKDDVGITFYCFAINSGFYSTRMHNSMRMNLLSS
ncbi:hypothetical protein HN011_004998 [Eciton burchellii]|nr:hypothetical protein HN011_004998 [Eciton burchellii]